jgi:hypothetical protein
MATEVCAARCGHLILDTEARYLIPEGADTEVTGVFHVNCGLKQDLLEDGLHLGEKLPFTFDLLAEIIRSFREDWEECDDRILDLVETGVGKLLKELELLAEAEVKLLQVEGGQ